MEVGWWMGEEWRRKCPSVLVIIAADKKMTPARTKSQQVNRKDSVIRH